MSGNKDLFSASAQALGYMYQSRLALLHLMRLPEETAILVEKDDDLDFIDKDGEKTLASLKHRAPSTSLTDLSTDFWKSVRIWLERYSRDGKTLCTLRFFLFTTSTVSEGSFLVQFLPKNNYEVGETLIDADRVLSETVAQSLILIKAEFDKLDQDEKVDFLSRIVIFHNSPRIEDIPRMIIDQHMRTIRTEFRGYVYERLEGWWNDLVIKLLTGKRKTEVRGRELSDKLSSISEEYKSDNLPINFRGKIPESTIDPNNDSRMFVIQLKEIGITSNRLQNAILDYYRAFEQRALWARQNVLIDGEIEDYENRLVEEWERLRNIVFEKLPTDSAEEALQNAGRDLFNWAEIQTGHLRIRDRVSESYVVRGSFQILANMSPIPKVYWHPQFLSRINIILSKATV